MAAPKGNQFWKLRSKHGRDKVFATPDVLWEACCEYFEWCDAHPWLRQEAIKSGPDAGRLIDVPTARPYTLSGLSLYLGRHEKFWSNFRLQRAQDEDFHDIIARVDMIIETQQLEGAMVGVFTAPIVARKLGLTEKTEVNATARVDHVAASPLNDLPLDKLKAIQAIIDTE